MDEDELCQIIADKDDEIADLEAKLEAFRAALEKIDTLEINGTDSMVNQVFRLKNIARNILVTADDGK